MDRLDFKNSSEYCREMAKKLREEEGYEEPLFCKIPFSYEDDQGREFFRPWIINLEKEEEEKEKAIQKHQNNMKKRFNLGGFPTSNESMDFVSASSEEFRDTGKFKLSAPQQEMINAFNSKNWVFAWGGTGGGKTSVACRLASNWMKEDPRRQAYFIPVSAWLNSLFGKGDEKYDAFSVKLKELKKAKLVVLDDFDKVTHSEWITQQLLRLVEMLYSSGTQVIITSNRSLAELSHNPKATIDLSPIIDRIRGKCGELGVIEFNHKSFR